MTIWTLEWQIERDIGPKRNEDKSQKPQMKTKNANLILKNSQELLKIV